jgi:acetyl-CoA carboxylase carboxyltransferase component
MAGQGFDPDFILSWPTGRMAVMAGESAVTAVFGDRVDDPELSDRVEKMRLGYEHQLDAKHAGAMGHADNIVVPEDTRRMLAFVLRVTGNYSGPHIGPFVLPPLEYPTT